MKQNNNLNYMENTPVSGSMLFGIDLCDEQLQEEYLVKNLNETQ